jgi:trk system potassium uptake protein TrkH
MGHKSDAPVQLVLMALIILGGIGFPILRELGGRGLRLVKGLTGRRAIPAERSTLQLRIVVRTSLFLVIAGASGIAVLEASNLLLGLDPMDGVLAAFFQSVAARTAGFNTVDLAVLRPATLLLLILLMFVGGSPGSTAGGVKTTTAAVILAAMRGEFRGQEPELSGRAIGPEAVRRATAVLVMSLMVVFTSLTLLTLTESHPFLHLAFETVSAYATVGSSTGITPSLSTAGKLVVMVTMFLGRVGPLTVALAVGGATSRRRHRLARGDLSIG